MTMLSLISQNQIVVSVDTIVNFKFFIQSIVDYLSVNFLIYNFNSDDTVPSQVT